MTLGKLQVVADAAEAGGHLCSGAHATHLARLHVLSPPIKSSKPHGLQIKFWMADIRPKEGVLPFCSHSNLQCSPWQAALSCRNCEQSATGLRAPSSFLDVLHLFTGCPASVYCKPDV